MALQGWAREKSKELMRKGIIAAKMGAFRAPDQRWHPDHAYKTGLLNVFVPLVDLTEQNGPTAVSLGSHRRLPPWCTQFILSICRSPVFDIVRPCLKAGSLLLFDWRTWHRGCANHGTHERPVIYITYARVGVLGQDAYKASLPSLLKVEQPAA